MKKFLRRFKKYQPESFWTKRGKTLYSDNPYDDEGYKKQTKLVLDYLKSLDFSTVLEFGCGYGRYTKLLLENFKIDYYLATDLSSDLVNQARDLTKDFDNVTFKVGMIHDLDIDSKFDLVFGTEVLQHVKNEDIKSCIDKLVNLSKKHVVNVDSYIDSDSVDLAFHCFNHNFEKIYSGNKSVNKVRRIRLPVFDHSLYHVTVN